MTTATVSSEEAPTAGSKQSCQEEAYILAGHEPIAPSPRVSDSISN